MQATGQRPGEPGIGGVAARRQSDVGAAGLAAERAPTSRPSGTHGHRHGDPGQRRSRTGAARVAGKLPGTSATNWPSTNTRWLMRAARTLVGQNTPNAEASPGGRS